jgi:PKD repeat protein
MAGQTTFTFSSTASDPDGDSLTYNWNFGDGSSGTGASPAKVFAAPGTYSVVVTVSDGKKEATAPAATVIVGQNLTATWTGGRENQFGCNINWVLVQNGLNLTGTMSLSGPCTGSFPGVTGTVSALTHPATVNLTAPPYNLIVTGGVVNGLNVTYSGTTVAPGTTMTGNLRMRQIPGTFDQSYAATYSR